MWIGYVPAGGGGAPPWTPPLPPPAQASPPPPGNRPPQRPPRRPLRRPSQNPPLPPGSLRPTVSWGGSWRPEGVRGVAPLPPVSTSLRGPGNKCMHFLCVVLHAMCMCVVSHARPHPSFPAVALHTASPGRQVNPGAAAHPRPRQRDAQRGRSACPCRLWCRHIAWVAPEPAREGWGPADVHLQFPIRPAGTAPCGLLAVRRPRSRAHGRCILVPATRPQVSAFQLFDVALGVGPVRRRI